MRAARAGFGLLPIVGGKDAEGHRDAGFERDLLQSARGFAGDEIEVRAYRRGSRRPAR